MAPRLTAADCRPPQACDRLKEEGLDCAACVAELPAPETNPAACPPRTAAEDAEAERAALWGDRAPRDLWNTSALLWDEEAGVRTLELEMSREDWGFLIADPTREQYRECAVRLPGLGARGRGRPRDLARSFPASVRQGFSV
jgi:hypothetical protein